MEHTHTRPNLAQSRRSASTRSCAIWSVLLVLGMRTPDGGRLRFGGPSKSFLEEALVRDLDPRTHQGGDDVVLDFSTRVRHAATSDDVEDGSRQWTRPQERIVRLGSIAIPRQSLVQNALYDWEHMVFNPWNCLPEYRPLGSVNGMRLAVNLASPTSCLAASTAETEHGGS